MSKLTTTQKHMTIDDRIFIEKELELKHSFRSIAAQLGKDPSTISKEIKKHRSFQQHNQFNEPQNKCALIKDCKKKNICAIYAPVCNACHKKNSCRLDKAYYRAATAHRQYRPLLVESRTGINISPEALTSLDELVSPPYSPGAVSLHDSSEPSSYPMLRKNPLQLHPIRCFEC